MTVSMSRSLQRRNSSVCCRYAAVSLALLVSACGGNGTAPSQNATTQQPLAAPTVAYPVPVYVQTLPGYAQGTQPPVQGWVMPQQMQQQQLQQQQLQQQGQMQQQVAPVPAPTYNDNPWAAQAQQQRYANSWASSQPWAPTNQSGGAVTGRYRPLEGETQQSAVTPPVVTPYDQAYGSSKRPLPTAPTYGGYAGTYPGQYPNQYAGGWPGGYGGGYGGGYPGGWPGGYGGGYPGGWPGGYGGGYPGGYGGGFPGGWPGGYGGGFPGMMW